MKEIGFEKFQASRRSWVDSGKFEFEIQRPTMLDVVKAGQGEARLNIEFAARFVTNWRKVTEADLIPGGDPEPVAFDPDIFKVWIAEYPALWRPISEGIAEAYRKHEERTEARGNV